MVRDDLLEQIQQPLLRRVDKRLAAVLAISIAAHIAVAVVAWLRDLPERVWLESAGAATYSEDLIELPPVVEPAPAPAAVPGVATPVAAPSIRPARPRAAAPLDPDAAMSGMFQSDPLLAAPSRRTPGHDLDKQLAEARLREGDARIGKDGREDIAHVPDGARPVLDGPDGPTRTHKQDEVRPPRILSDPAPPPGLDYDPANRIRSAYDRGLQRCYKDAIKDDPTLHGRIDLTFTIGVDGTVTAAAARGAADMAAVADCVEERALGWTFPISPAKPVQFRLPMIFLVDSP